jgi:hypothetical protein
VDQEPEGQPTVGPAAALAGAVYVLLALVLTYPLVWRLSSAVPHDAGDPLLNVWLIWWNSRVVPLTSQWWNAPTFYPLPGVLALSEHLLGLAPLTSPVQWLGASPLAAYNVVFLLSFPLSAAAAWWLVLSLTRRRDAAFIAGLAFGFAPYRVSQLAHLQVICSYLMPVALLALHRYVDEGRRRWLVVFFLAWLLESLTCGYYLFYFSVLIGLWILWFAARGPTLRRMAAILGTWAAAAACLVPILWRYLQIQDQLGLHRAGFEADFFSADLVSLLQGSHLLRFWKVPFRPGTSESLLFPGLTVIVLVALAVFRSLRQKGGARAVVSRVRAALWALTVSLALVALSPLVIGPWSASVAGVTLSVGQLYKPLSLATLCGLALVLTGRRFRAAYRRRSIFLFYACATATMWLLCLGPSPRLLGQQILYKAPYSWLMQLPGFDAMRVPPRFAMLATLSIAVAAGCAVAALTARASRARRLTTIAACTVGLCADGWIAHLPLVPAPGSIELLRTASLSGAVLELPLGDGTADAAALYRSMEHRRPLVNGYSGFTPPHYWALRLGLGQYDRATFAALTEHGPMTVAIHEASDPDGRLSELVSSQRGARRLGRDADTSVYLMPRGPSAPVTGDGGEWPILQIRASVAGVAVAGGHLPGSWCSPGPQQGTEEILIDLGSTRPVRSVVLTLGTSAEKLPRALVVETAADDREWVEAWRGSVAALAFRGALDDPVNVPVVVPLGHRQARQLRLRQVGSDDKYPWCFVRIAVTGR